MTYEGCSRNTLFQKYAKKFNINHNLHLIKLCFWNMKLEHISTYLIKFEQNKLKKHMILRLLRQLWVSPRRANFNFILC